MKLEDQCVSLELAKRLKELGVKQESLFYWCEPWPKDTDQTPHVNTWHYATESNVRFKYSAFTVAELGDLLPKKIGNGRWLCTYGYLPISPVEFNNEADARALMVCYLIENKLMEV